MSQPRNLKEWFDHHAVSQTTQAVLAFPESPESHGGLKYYGNAEIHRYALAAVNFYHSKHVPIATDTSSVVAISAPGTVEWLVTFIALARMGYCILALSPRLSEESRGELVQKAQCAFVIRVESGTAEPSPVRVVPCISPEQLLDFANGDTETALTKTATAPVPTTAFIWHSSGSTGLPKLFNLGQAEAIVRLNGLHRSKYGNSSVWIASSTYNGAGLTFLLASLAKSTWTAFHNDRLPLTGQGLVQFLAECRPTIAIFTPGSLEMLICENGGIAQVQQIEDVAVFGAVCPKYLGDILVSNGIFFTTVLDYMSPLPNPVRENLWFKPFDKVPQHGRHTAADMHELVVLAGLPGLVAEQATGRDPPGSFYTGDVFVKHSTKENRWKLIGRKDDQINMGIPVVVNALQYEEAIKAGCSEAAVDDVVLFGQGREQLGILVFIKPDSKVSDDAVRSAVWKSVETEINGKMEVGVEMSMIIPAHIEVPRTDKQNIKRAATYALFEDVINNAYLQ